MSKLARGIIVTLIAVFASMTFLIPSAFATSPVGHKALPGGVGSYTFQIIGIDNSNYVESMGGALTNPTDTPIEFRVGLMFQNGNWVRGYTPWQILPPCTVAEPYRWGFNTDMVDGEYWAVVQTANPVTGTVEQGWAVER